MYTLQLVEVNDYVADSDGRIGNVVRIDRDTVLVSFGNNAVLPYRYDSLTVVMKAR